MLVVEFDDDAVNPTWENDDVGSIYNEGVALNAVSVPTIVHGVVVEEVVAETEPSY